MSHGLTRLYPTPVAEVEHAGCYLNTPLVPEGHDGLFLYTNFVTSLDGRIAIVPRGGEREVVPKQSANARDWRLFQELAGHADVLITSGRYLRQLRAGNAQDVLPVGTGTAFADIRRWRRARGKPEQPAVAVLSASLDFTIPPVLREQQRQLLVITVPDSPVARREALAADGVEVVLTTGREGRVTGADTRAALEERGYRTAYSVTGPWVLGSLVADGCLDALFLTTTHCLLGGTRYATLLEGDPLEPAADFRLTTLYHDAAAPEGVGQTFARYDRRHGGRPYD